MDNVDRFIVVVFVLCAFAIGLTIGGCAGVESQQDEAVKSGVGYWEQIDCGRQTRFVYGVKTPAENSEEFDCRANEGKND